MPESSVPSSTPAARGVPLSLAQQAALLPERMRRTPAANLFVALEISPGLDAEALDRAAVAVISRHEILRTVYPDDRRIPYQRVVPAPESVVEVVEPDGAQLTRVLLDDAAHAFDLLAGPPVRIRLYRLADRDVLSLAAHPVAADDRSIELLVAVLFAAYDGAPVPEAAQYRTFAAAQLKTLAADASGDADLNYWLERLADLPERAEIAPADPEAGAGQSVSPAAHRVFRLPIATIGALAADVTVDTALAAVVARALSEAGMGDDIAVGVADAGRGTDAEAAFGAYANHLVLRLDPAADRTPRQSIEDAARVAAEARAHAATRIERLTHQLRGAAAVSSGVLFQALVNVRSESASAPAGRTVRELARRVARPHGVDIAVDVVTDTDGATVTVGFSPALAGHPGIDGFAGLLEQLCADWAAGPDVPQSSPASAPVLFTRVDAPETGATGLGGAPRTDAERTIASAIREILELEDDDEVGRADTFFSLGGDSIAALRLVTLLGERGYTLDVQKVFEFPAIHELAEQLTDADTAAGAEEPAAPEVAPMAASGLDQAALQALGRKFAAQ